MTVSQQNEVKAPPPAGEDDRPPVVPNAGSPAANEAAIKTDQDQKVGMKKRKMKAEVHEFEVLDGTYCDLDTGKVYGKDGVRGVNAGPVVVSALPLDEMHANKFRRLTGYTRRFAGYDPTVDNESVMDPPLHLKDRPEAEEDVPAKVPYQAPIGSVIVPNDPRTKARGPNPVESEAAQEVEEKLKAKFPPPQAAPQEEEEEEDEGAEDEHEEEDHPEHLGEDLTGAFPKAKKGGLKVFKSEDGYQVYEEDDLASPLNDEPFTTKKDATAFVNKHVK